MQIPPVSRGQHLAHNLFQISSTAVPWIERLEQCADGMTAYRALGTLSIGSIALGELIPQPLDRQREFLSGFGLMTMRTQVIERDTSDNDTDLIRGS